MDNKDKPLTDSVPIDAIRSAGYNPRTISTNEFKSLQRSINEFGLVEPVICNTNGSVIISGHQRWRAAKALGHKTISVVWVTLGPAKEKALNIAMNRIGGEFDENMLAELIVNLDEGLEELTGFTEDELTAMSADPFDEEPEDKAKTPKYTTKQLRSYAKSYHPVVADSLMEFIDWLDEHGK